MDGDYLSGPYNITFKAGNMIAPFNISIIDDNIFEIDENFTLTIFSYGNYTFALVIILDDDGECLLLICIIVLLGTQLYLYKMVVVLNIIMVRLPSTKHFVCKVESYLATKT